MQKKLPKSIRKYIRQEKARIRREVLGAKEQEKLIVVLCEKFQKKKKLVKTPVLIQTDKQAGPPASAMPKALRAGKKTEKKKAPKTEKKKAPKTEKKKEPKKEK